jgi:hypothetical protein
MNQNPTPILSNRTYDIGKHLALVVLPALGALYFALSQIWGFPHGEEVVGTVVALEVFLGLALGLSNKQYVKSEARFDGALDIVEDDDSKTFALNYYGDPYDLDKQDEVVFKVNKSAN